MSHGVLDELRDALIVGTHPGTRCTSSGMAPVEGPLYRSTRDARHALSEAAYRQTPTAERVLWAGPFAPLSAPGISERLRLARAVLMDELLEGHTHTWFNDDDHYAVAVGVPLMVKRALLESEAPPLLRVVLGAAAASPPVRAEPPPGVSRFELVQPIQTAKNGALWASRLEAIDRTPEALWLRRLSDPTVAHVGRDVRALDGASALAAGLQHVELRACRLLRSLPEGVGEWRQVSSIDLSECSALEALPEALFTLRSLCTLTLGHCCALTSLPGGEWAMDMLVSLRLHGCSELLALPDGLTTCRSLRELNLQVGRVGRGFRI